MKRTELVIAVALMAVTVAVDLWFIHMGAGILGFFSLLGTILLVGCGLMWAIRYSDQTLKIVNWYLMIPLGLFVFSMYQAAKGTGLDFRSLQEDLALVGQLVMSRYLVGLWIIGLGILAAFVVTSFLLKTETRE